MMFFFLCDAAIYLLKYYSNVRTIVLFVHLATFESILMESSLFLVLY